MKPIVISFYTDDHHYPQAARKLMAQCAALGLDHDIQQLESDRDWLKNTCKKPAYILDRLRAHRQPVLWIDADCSLMREPVDVYGATEDVGLVRMPGRCMKPWYVATMWFNYTEATLRLVERWVVATGSCSDHSAFYEIGEAGALDEVSIRVLPKSYCAVTRMERRGAVVAVGLSDWSVKRKQMAELVAARGY